MSNKLRTITTSHNGTLQELADYKVRATKVLQSKEKELRDLKAKPKENLADVEDEDERIDEREQLRKERDEWALKAAQVEQSLAELMGQTDAERDVLQSQIRNFEDSLEREKRKVQQLQMDNFTKSNEISAQLEEHHKAVEQLQHSLLSKDDLIAKLKRQLAKAASSASQEELEHRLQSITESLIQKQKQLETLSSEKAYLQLKLESALQASKALEEKVTDIPRERTSSGARHRWSSLESGDNSVEAVKGNAFADAVQTVTGRYLRRYPRARMAVFGYIIALHLWVIYVSASWNPEIHND